MLKRPENHLIQLIRKPQRASEFHERIGKGLMICEGGLLEPFSHSLGYASENRKRLFKPKLPRLPAKCTRRLGSRDAVYKGSYYNTRLPNK
jgi:hypothetical protein